MSPARRPRPELRGHRRPVHGWWRRQPSYRRYLVREGTALFLSAYALVLLAGLACLLHGDAAWAAWRAVLAAPLSIVLHGVAAGAAAFHAWTWFGVMPLTMPPLPVPARVIVAAGLAASAGCTALLVAAAGWVLR